MCIDAKTGILHTESDVTHTRITVQEQNMGSTCSNSKNKTSFLFQIHRKYNTGIHFIGKFFLFILANIYFIGSTLVL